MGRFAKNFLPILFNVHTQQLAPEESDPSRLAILDTIRAYLTITDAKVAYFFKHYILPIVVQLLCIVDVHMNDKESKCQPGLKSSVCFC